MSGLSYGRLLGLAWCCTVEERGAERALAYGWTPHQARRRCVRKLHNRTTVTSGGTGE
jgi:hypothetical protein